MKRKKLSVLTACLALLLGLLAGCGRGDDAEITTEDFYGCWEYEAYDLWLVVHEDEAYDWISPTDTSSGTYTVEDGELVLDNSMRYTQDGKGGLVDSDGDALFASELPEEGQSGGAASIEDFYGCWEYDDTDIGIWIDIRDDGTYIWHWGIGSSSGEYYLEGEELVTDNGRRYTLDGMGGLVDDEGDTLSPSQLPDSGSDGDESGGEDDSFPSFVGQWVYDDFNIMVTIYEDGTCDWSRGDGTYNSGSCWMEGDVLRMELDDSTVMEFSLRGDGLIDHEGDTLSRGTLSVDTEEDWGDEEDDWYYEEPAAGNGGFVGCWESVDSDDWLCLYSDGTYEWYSEDGLVSSSTYENYGDEICLDMGADMWFYMGTDGSIYDEEGSWEMFPSQLPDYLR